MMSVILTKTLQTVAIASSLVGAGGIATLSLFDIPEIQSQPANRSLPMIRWLFSRGSHIFPSASFLSFLTFLYLAYDALPANLRTLTQILRSTNGFRVNGYLVAAILSISIAPWTMSVMVPNNFALIKKNADKGGARSAKAAEELAKSGYKPGERSALDSVNGKGEGDEFTDLSGPQEKTELDSTEEEDEEVRQMLGTFARQNAVRAVLLGAGGVVGLLAAIY
ncbi:hypothetical protein DOTSEDRAFT_69315 [Lecanosticta acicola]|uniref:DUF1772-domain-containing protein n=1 Tax=Lecanosticta acicola TaxID=111012 RepID=A0AAI8YX86_9PEZI|nr:hypothetical protein DOTSEDRAFT_69315 [Lecanosticta acicola]